MKKKILFIMMFCVVSYLNLTYPVFAMEQEKAKDSNDALTAFKETVKENEKVGEYDVKISVPGKDGVELHDEVILMVDGSYSMDNEWPLMKNAIIEIGSAFLNGTGNTQLTLMAFGMGDNEVLTHVKSVDELKNALGELPGTLLYGRSSTNCEAGFTGVIDYIRNHDETINDVHVVFISDGNINTDETPYNFYNWKENTWLRYSIEKIVSDCFKYECLHILNGGNLSNAFITVFGEDVDVNLVMETATLEQKLEWADLVWNDVYEMAEMNPEEAYPVSDAERAFVRYDDVNDTYIQNLFYYALVGRSYPDRWSRTPVAANELALMEEVEMLYMVDYDSYSSWMDTGVTAANSKFIKSDGIAGLVAALEGVITDLSSTTFYNPIVRDYTSKWVIPVDVNDDGIFDVKDIVVTNNGKIVTDLKIDVINLSTITLEEINSLSLEEQEEIRGILANNPDLKDNSNGYVYRIKWSIKEGMLNASDNYELTYKVKVDTGENGYVSGGDYNANSNVDLTYDKTENVNGTTENVTEPGIVIKKDPVIQEENVITITKTDENGDLLSGSDFELSCDTNSDENIIKEFSINGNDWFTWDYINPNYNAFYFRFSNLYNFKYNLSEIKTPYGYIGVPDMVYDFTNMEGKKVEKIVVNTSIKSEVIIHYVVKVGDSYIPFNQFAYDDDGILLPIFDGINIEDIVITGKLGDSFETVYEDIDGLSLVGLYAGNLKDGNLNRLDNDKYSGIFKEKEQEYTYVFEVNVGTGDEEVPMPPMTGYEFNIDFIYMLITCLFCFFRRF